MCSVEIVDVINALRGPGKAEMMHNDFMKKVRLHPGIEEGNFSSSYLGGNGKQEPCYYLPKREADSTPPKTVTSLVAGAYQIEARALPRGYKRVTHV